MLEEILKKIVEEKRREGAPDFVIRNFLKEYLQYPVLEFIYGNGEYKKLIFNGGSCLRICFDAPRLSEDLDFDLAAADFKKLKIERLADDLKRMFREKYLAEIEVKLQADKRIYLKFLILKSLGIAKEGESDFLYVKVEPSKSAFSGAKMEIQPISKFGFNFIARRYDLKFLMTGKLNAIFTREWFKGKNNEINIKGRDFYDLYWYMEKKIEPDYKNLKKLTGISDKENLKKELRKRIENDLTSTKLSYDLKNFFPNQDFIIDFCRNYKKIMDGILERY
ncbi:MAG: nucleotidyl transferase AbiEii/AbiGii toxin family protein [bacterium]